LGDRQGWGTNPNIQRNKKAVLDVGEPSLPVHLKLMGVYTDEASTIERRVADAAMKGAMNKEKRENNR